jgi:hypothetical protein
MSWFFKRKKQQFHEEKIKHILRTGYINPNKVQRNIEEDRITDLIIDFDKSFQPYVPIYFCIFEKQRYIVDGQHRLKIYSNYTKYHAYTIPVCDIYVDTLNEIQEIFEVINNRLALNDMWTKPQDIKEILIDTYHHFERKYPNTFKFKGKRRPFINKEVFKTQITMICEEMKLTSSTELISKIEYINKCYSLKESDYFPTKGKTSNCGILTTIEKGGCMYLGMIEEWTRHCKDEKVPSENPESDYTGNRPKVWEKYMGNIARSKCYCCKQHEITAFNFEAGHVVARALGGKDNVDNLRPICGYCNKSMGIQNLYEYQKKNFS